MKGKLWIFILTIFYAFFAFFRLGDFTAPTSTDRFKADEQIRILFDHPANIDTMSVYYEIGEGEFAISSLEKGNFVKKSTFKQDYIKVFIWDYKTLSTTTSEINATFTSGEVALSEVAFYDSDHNLIKPSSVIRVHTDGSEEVLSSLTDEQDKTSQYTTYESGTYFDEIYFARTAFEHLHELPYYETTHPPLGKLLLSIGISIFGMNPFGWRVMGTLTGVIMIPIFYFMVKKVFKHESIALVAATLLAVDFMQIAQTRIGTVDSYLSLFIMLMYLCMFRYYQTGKFGPLLASGIFFGLGAATKWIALYGAPGLCIIFLLHLWKHPQIKRILYGTITFLVIPGAIYYASFIPIMMLPDHSFSFSHFWDLQMNMYNYHHGLSATHPFSSPWWSWLLDKRPIWYFTGQDFLPSTTMSTISSFGNPFLFWTGIAMIFYSIYLAIRQKHILLTLTLIAFFSQLLPWIFISRIAFIYHIFSTLPFLILIITIVLTHISNTTGRKIALAYTFIACALFVLFYPVLSGIEVPSWYVQYVLKWFPSWSF